jgi:signal peptidase I
LGAFGPLVSPCGLELSRDVERIEVAVAEPAELRMDLSGTLSVDAVRCVLATLKEHGAFDGVELDALLLPHGVRVATRGARVDGVGAPSPLARRFEELSAHAELAAVSDLAPGGSFELWTDRQGTATLHAALRSRAEATRASTWLKRALAAEPTGGLRNLTVTAEDAALNVVARNPRAEQGVLLRQNVIEAFQIPSGSMLPTLVPGDRFFAIKGPTARSPARGDIVVFVSPPEPSQDFVKRVIGIAGDRVELDGYTVRVNGSALEETKLEDADYVGSGPEPLRGALWRESNGPREYRVFRDASHPSADALDVVVEPDHVFLLGDNRDNSFDSRQFGSVPTSSLKGRVAVIWASFGEHGVNWERFGSEPE